MGGMTKGEARQFLRKMGRSAERMLKLEQQPAYLDWFLLNRRM
jgi:hypothetical protein